jgi:hypothetical protein
MRSFRIAVSVADLSELGKMDAAARKEMTADYLAFTQSIVQSGHFKAGDGLQLSTMATTVRVLGRNGAAREAYLSATSATQLEPLRRFYARRMAELDESADRP